MNLLDYCDFKEFEKSAEDFFGKKTYMVLNRLFFILCILGLIEMIGSVVAYNLGITDSINNPFGNLIFYIIVGTFIIAGICKFVYWLISKVKLCREITNSYEQNTEGTIEVIEPSHNEDPLKFMPKSSVEFQTRQEEEDSVSSELETVETAPVDTNAHIEMMYCKHCGKRIETDSAFCKYCGKKL